MYDKGITNLRTIKLNMDIPDYKKYSLKELEEVLVSIDKSKFYERYNEVLEEFESRKKELSYDIKPLGIKLSSNDESAKNPPNQTIKKTSYYIEAIALIVMLFLLLTKVDYYDLLSVYVFLIIWSVDKCILWAIGEEFGIASQLNIKRNSPSGIRFLGLLFALFVMYVGIFGLLKHNYI